MTSRGAIEACLYLFSGVYRTWDYGLNGALWKGSSDMDASMRDAALANIVR